jgi:hypothetical protein
VVFLINALWVIVNYLKGILMKKELGDAPLYLGGWLIFIGIRLIGGIAANGSSVLQSFNRPLNTLGLITNILLLLFNIYSLFVLWLFTKRHKAFPATYISLESFAILSNISSFFILFRSNTIEGNAFWLPYTVVLPAISILWIVYMLVSKRVKKTFVYNWNNTLDRQLNDKASSI